MLRRPEVASVSELGLGGGGAIGGVIMGAGGEKRTERYEGFSAAERRARELGPIIAEQGACRDMDPDLFLATITSEMGKRAAAACRSCTVRDECVEYGALIGDFDSIRGGLGKNKRKVFSKMMLRQGEWKWGQPVSMPRTRGRSD